MSFCGRNWGFCGAFSSRMILCTLLWRHTLKIRFPSILIFFFFFTVFLAGDRQCNFMSLCAQEEEEFYDTLLRISRISLEEDPQVDGGIGARPAAPTPASDQLMGFIEMLQVLSFLQQMHNSNCLLRLAWLPHSPVQRLIIPFN